MDRHPFEKASMIHQLDSNKSKDIVIEQDNPKIEEDEMSPVSKHELSLIMLKQRPDYLSQKIDLKLLQS